MENIVPSLLDGLKESERIILFCALKKHGFNEVNVQQLAMDTYAFKPRTKYLLPKRVAAIVKMAQNFVGANNINLFLPIGNFGSQSIPDLTFGTDLIVKLNPAVRMLFREDDDVVANDFFNQCEECGRVPSFLLPIIPLVLVNGTDCTISKYRSYVPMYKLKDIIFNLRCLLKKEDMKPMIPWFEGFKGTVEACQDDNAKFIVTGAINNIDFDTKTVDIIELPIGTQAQDYIKLLEDGSIHHKGFVDSSDYDNRTLCLRVSLLDEDCKMDVKQLMERLKLTRIISLNEMYLRDVSGPILRYKSPLEVIRKFCSHRLQFFARRRDFIMKDISSQIKDLDNEICISCSNSKQCLDVLNVLKRRLSHDLIGLFDECFHRDLIEFIDEDIQTFDVYQVVGTLTTLLNRIGNTIKQSTSGKLYVLMESENQIRRLIIVLQDLKKFRSNRSVLLQKLDNLDAASAYSLWLDDLDQLEDFFSGQDDCSLVVKKRIEADTHSTQGTKRKGPLLDDD